MTHQPTQLLSRVWSGPVGVCVIGLQLNFPLHSSLVPDNVVGIRPPYDSTVELGWLMCHGLYYNTFMYHLPFFERWEGHTWSLMQIIQVQNIADLYSCCVPNKANPMHIISLIIYGII